MAIHSARQVTPHPHSWPVAVVKAAGPTYARKADMVHIITHIIHDDGKHELWNFDDEGMTVSHESGDPVAWGSGYPQPRPTITLTGSGTYVATDQAPSLDDGVAALVTYLTKRATEAERATKAAESRARNARAAERASILALLSGEDGDEDKGEGCHICGGPDH